MANDAIDHAPNLKDKEKREPINIFLQTEGVNINSKHWKPFGCPVYVLDNALQQKHPFHKWKDRAKVGLYLGKSPHHARNVALVLNLETGLVSPQFHLKFDTRFHTVKQENFDSKWQTKAGFILQREPSRPQEKVNNSVSKIQREKKRQRTSLLTGQDKD